VSAPDRARLAQAAGGFLHDLAPWTWWATLTFESDVSHAAAMRAFKRWLRELARDVARVHVAVAWGYGLQGRGVLHFHVLLAPMAGGLPLTAAACRRAWRRAHRLAGHARMTRCDPAGGAAWYLAKHAEWDANVACPRRPRCRRARGCVEAPGAW
jgi:hypothetical protein